MLMCEGVGNQLGVDGVENQLGVDVGLGRVWGTS
jgi:hypothetical protein